MDRPIEIAFHGLQGSPALEDDIRAHVAKLEQHCTNLVSCRVTLEASSGKGQPHGQVGVHIMLCLHGGPRRLPCGGSGNCRTSNPE